MRLPQYYKRACKGGWLLCDHRQKEDLPPRQGNAFPTPGQGKPLHTQPISKDDAAMLADGLNSGTLTLEEVLETLD